MLTGIILVLGIATWVMSHIKFQTDGYSVGFHIHLDMLERLRRETDGE